jgi:hypothetical protein
VNWHALRAVGEAANQRLCDAQAADARPAPDVATLTEVTRPSTTDDGQHAPALRFGDPRVMATMSAIVGFSHLLTGFNNKTLTGLMANLLDAPYTARQARSGAVTDWLGLDALSAVFASHVLARPPSRREPAPITCSPRSSGASAVDVNYL